ncbi:LysE family translocator [Rhizobium tubonense]|uniref:LysE family translocator n=1 Tax=Rhizobium tubonense TaxID=484088 RepID=UPI0023B9CB3C|nr:LysE family transporter [Rhizobium tubonense]
MKENKGALTPMQAWQMGLATNLANPKSALFVASLFAATMSPGERWIHGAAGVAVMMAISAVWYGFLALALSHRSAAQVYQKARRVVDAMAGVIFIGFGAKLAFSQH